MSQQVHPIRPEDIGPLTDFLRNHHPTVERLRETGRPEVLTVHGKAAVVVQDAEAYQRMLELAEQMDTISRRHTHAIAKPRQASDIESDFTGMVFSLSTRRVCRTPNGSRSLRFSPDSPRILARTYRARQVDVGIYADRRSMTAYRSEGCGSLIERSGSYYLSSWVSLCYVILF